MRSTFARHRCRAAAPLLFGMAVAIRSGGKQAVHGTSIMKRLEPALRAVQCVGVVHRVDLVNRELTVFVRGGVLTFDVPVGCEIALHRERVRLRMVQPRDRVRVTYARRGGFLVALGVEVQPEDAFAEDRRCARNGPSSPGRSSGDNA